MMEMYAQFYPALRRLLRLGIAVVVYHGQDRNGNVAQAFVTADEFLSTFDSSTFNLGQQLQELQNPAFRIADLVGMTSKDFSALSAQQLNDKLKGVSDYSKLPASIQEVDKTAVQRFLQAYQNEFLSTVDSPTGAS